MTAIKTLGFSVDTLAALLWQYDDAPKLQTLLAKKQEWYDRNQTGFWSDWVRDVFDLRTANDFGLSVWSIILDLPLVAQVGPTPASHAAWGFGSYRKNFDHGNFARDTGGAIALDTEQRRLALRLRYFQLVSRGTVPEINQFMAELFKDLGRVYVLDPLDMTFAIYVFTFSPSSAVRFILDRLDVLPRPAGVGVKYTIATRVAFGFGASRRNFDHGNFVRA